MKELLQRQSGCWRLRGLREVVIRSVIDVVVFLLIKLIIVLLGQSREQHALEGVVDPDNSLLDIVGHCQVCDAGLAVGLGFRQATPERGDETLDELHDTRVALREATQVGVSAREQHLTQLLTALHEELLSLRPLLCCGANLLEEVGFWSSRRSLAWSHRGSRRPEFV